MIRAITLILAAAVAFPAAAPAATCPGPDPAITSVSVKSVAKSNALNHYTIVGTVTNVGAQKQASNVIQTIEILDGAQPVEREGDSAAAGGPLGSVYLRLVALGRRRERYDGLQFQPEDARRGLRRRQRPLPAHVLGSCRPGKPPVLRCSCAPQPGIPCVTNRAETKGFLKQLEPNSVFYNLQREA